MKLGFFDPLRQALSFYAAGVHLAGDPASQEALDQAAERVGSLPEELQEFLSHFDGVSLFNEAVTLFAAEQLMVAQGVPQGTPAPLVQIGSTPEGVLAMDPAGKIYQYDEEEPDPILVGSSLAAFLAATLKREGQIYDREGEFRDVMDEEGELLPPHRKKRAQIGRRLDPNAALPLFEEAELAIEAGEDETARDLLHRAVELDPRAGAAWELLSALALAKGDYAGAEQASLRAAEATPAPWLRASRLLSAAEAAEHQGGEAALRVRSHAESAQRADPNHGHSLLEQAREALAASETEEAERLTKRLSILASAVPAQPLPGVAELTKQVRTRQALRVV